MEEMERFFVDPLIIAWLSSFLFIVFWFLMEEIRAAFWLTSKELITCWRRSLFEAVCIFMKEMDEETGPCSSSDSGLKSSMALNLALCAPLLLIA